MRYSLILPQKSHFWKPLFQKLDMRLYSTPSFNDCELNYIEYYWGALKRHTRENCKYSFAELETTIFDAMESITLRMIRQFAGGSKRWMVSYINGLIEEQRNYTEKVYKSHRHVYRPVFV